MIVISSIFIFIASYPTESHARCLPLPGGPHLCDCSTLLAMPFLILSKASTYLSGKLRRAYWVSTSGRLGIGYPLQAQRICVLPCVRGSSLSLFSLDIVRRIRVVVSMKGFTPLTNTRFVLEAERMHVECGVGNGKEPLPLFPLDEEACSPSFIFVAETNECFDSDGFES